MSEPLEAALRRLKDDREEADRRYNDALTALDRALRPPPEVPEPPAAYDEHQITPLNETWNILPDPAEAGGLKGKLKGVVWRSFGPYFQRQLAFNSRLVDHINRNVAAHRDARRAADAAVAALREHMAVQAEIQSRLMFLLQQVTAFVDTRDRDAAGGALILNRALSGLADGTAKRAESAGARVARLERRLETRTASLEEGQRDLRMSMAVTQRAAAALKRELESGAGSHPDPAGRQASSGSGSADPSEAFSGRLDAYKYVGFEDQFRGSQDVIRERFESYLPFFERASPVLDIGCGRGEFLDLLASRSVQARGVDLNPEMVEVCRARGLDATHADAAGYLAGMADASLGGIFAAQVVEHLEPAYLLRLLELAFHKLRPGGRLVLETLNPACWLAFFESYIRDITHVRPLHPETLKYLVLASGFTTAAIEYRSPIPPADRLQPMNVPADAGPAVDDLARTFNANVARLNALLFTHMDYAVVAEKTAAGG